MKRATPLILLASSGCAILNPPPVVENRFRAVQGDSFGIPAIDIAVTTAPVEREGGGVSIIQLSDRAQAALVTETKGHPPLKIRADGDDGPAAVTSIDKLERHIVVSVHPATFLSPGDRIDAIRVELEVAPGQRDDWRISGWTFASNGQKIIDVGKLTDVATAKLSASTGVKALDFLPDASISGEASRSRTREADIKDTTDFDAAVDDQGRAWLDETAAWRESLAHNLSMDAVIVAPPGKLLAGYVATSSKLTREDPKTKSALPALATQVRLSETAVLAHEKADAPVCGVARLTYRIRHIVDPKAQGTFTESDDTVQFLRGTANTTFLLAPAPYEPVYALQTARHRLSYVPAGGTSTGLVFASREEATLFRDWLRAVLPKAGQLQNASVGIALSRTTIRGLTKTEAQDLLVVVADPDKARAAETATNVKCLPPLSPPAADPGAAGPVKR